LINEKNLDQKDDIIIYWKANVSPVPAEGTRKRIFGISYWFEDGIYYIARIENRQGNIKFLYAFSTEIPADPHVMPIGVCRTMKKIAEEVRLKYSNRTSYLTPVFYILEDTVNFKNYLTLESKAKELKKNLDLPLFNSKNDLKVFYGSGWHKIGR